ncbi:MAG: hypothetical protein M1839_001480 [Geoglossum umbratile]|nr:MAG: hypothetical protein M1839_001480 [Geoglossum umbratile]
MVRPRQGPRPRPKPSAGIRTRQPLQTFKLLYLPREIILKIFCYVMAYPVSINYFKHTTTYSNFHGPPDLALFRVCHCVRDAALVAFSRVNTFILNTTHGIPKLWMKHEFLERLTTVEFVIPVRSGHAKHEVEVLDLLGYVRAFVHRAARMRFVIESRDGTVMGINDPIMKTLARMQQRTGLGWRRPVVTFEEHRELGWTAQKVRE